MAHLTTQQAVSKLKNAIRSLGPEGIVDVYDELFPEAPADPSAVKHDLPGFVKLILDHFEKGLETEEIVDLWRVVFPNVLRVHFDESTDEIEYSDVSVASVE